MAIPCMSAGTYHNRMQVLYQKIKTYAQEEMAKAAEEVKLMALDFGNFDVEDNDIIFWTTV